MKYNIARIRAALELASEIVPPMFATHAKIEDGLAALAELEKAAAEPVAWMWNDDIGVPHASAGSKKPVWLESSASAEYIKQANLRPLYAAPPAPIAEIREVVVTDEMCNRAYISKWRGVPELIDYEPDDEDRQWAREWLIAWRRELGPALGLVEIREPTPGECERICAAYFVDKTPASHVVPLGRAMASAVRAGLRPAFGLIQPMEPTPEVERKDYALTAIIQIAERRPDCTDILTIARAARLPEKD